MYYIHIILLYRHRFIIGNFFGYRYITIGCRKIQKMTDNKSRTNFVGKINK